jgi:hypothetical protein
MGRSQRSHRSCKLLDLIDAVLAGTDNPGGGGDCGASGDATPGARSGGAQDEEAGVGADSARKVLPICVD